MKNSLRKLRAIGRMLDLRKFYAISMYTCSIELQGKYNPELVLELIKKFKFIDAGICPVNGYPTFKRGIITITLT